MTKIKVGDRVRFLLSGLEAVILRIDEKDNSFQVIVRGVWYKFDLVELIPPLKIPMLKGHKPGDRVRNVETQEEVTVALAGYFLCEKDQIWRNPQGYELVKPLRTKLIPFQADKWTPEMQVVTDSGSPVRILCVDAECGPGYPVLGLVNNEKVQHWSCDGKERNEARGPFGNLRFVVEPKTKTLYGYWNDTRKQDYAYESESMRDLRFEEYSNQDTDIRIKFQTDIEL